MSVGEIDRVLISAEERESVDIHKADVHWPVPTHVPDMLMPSHFDQFESGNALCRMLQRNCDGDGGHLVAFIPDNIMNAEANVNIFEALWSKRSYRWRCRLWFIWREYVRDVWDFLKKPMLIGALVFYPIIHVLAAVGILGCDCPPPP